MKPLLILLTLLCVANLSCKQSTASDKIQNWRSDIYTEVVEIDGCEYIVATRLEAISIIHKQNCKYHIKTN